MHRDYSEYVPSEQERYRLARRGNQFITFEYFNNFVRFNAAGKTLDIRADGKKESLWMDELVEEYETAREKRGGEEFVGLDEDGTAEDWKDKGNFNTRYCDRIEEYSGRTCQELAAQENFKKKTVGRI